MTVIDTRDDNGTDPVDPAVDLAEGPAPVVETEIVIIGTGFAGTGTAVRLRQQGRTDFVVLDRAESPGGTWQANTYPGCRCDVPSHLYSFSFAPNPGWTNTFSYQPEIRRYLEDCVERFGIGPHIRWGHALVDASWDDDAKRWDVTTTKGRFRSRFLVLGTGALVEPSIPDVKGFDSFEGAVFHTARWDADHDLTGERVAVIGTGASSIQLVPQIQPQVGHLDLYQRTATWIMPHSGRDISRFERALYRRLPFTQRIARAFVYCLYELSAFGFTKLPKMLNAGRKVALKHLHAQVEDPELRKKLTPDFHFGCKRVLKANDYFPALTQPNVDVVTDGIAEVKAHSIVAADGTEREVDTIILGTGFKVTNNPTHRLIHGRGGRPMSDLMDRGEGAYLGTMGHDFPNAFVLMGPNTGLGHTSQVFMIESQIAFILDCLREVDERGAAAVEPKADVQERFNDGLQEKLKGTVWATGCASWYLDAKGRNSVLWPDFTFRFRKLTAKVDPDDLEIVAPATPVPAPERELEPVATA